MKECSIPECDRQYYARGWCSKHYVRWKKHGDPLVVEKAGVVKVKYCTVTGCEREIVGRGLCKMHYERWKVHGDPSVVLKRGPEAKSPAKTVGRLTVIEDTGERRGREPVWLCRCVCGNEVRVRSSSLASGETRSCGCLQRDVAAGRVAPLEERKAIREKERRKHYRRKYGLELEEAEALLAKGCAICKTKDDLAIDHDHANGKVRAALCRKCNSVLGYFADDPARFRRAAEYLEAHT